MAEKIYQDNIVLHKHAMDELLTQIRNYPITDIQEVSATDYDLINQDRNVWNTYTGGHPAWRVCFGDPDNLSGNYTKDRMGSEQLAALREAENEIRIAEQKAALYTKYQGSIDDYNKAIRNVKSEFQAVLDAVEATYRNQKAQLFNYLSQCHYNAGLGSDTATYSYTTDFNNIRRQMRLQYVLTNGKIVNYINYRTQGIQQSSITGYHYFSTDWSSSTRYPDSDNPVVSNSPIEILGNLSATGGIEGTDLWIRLNAIINNTHFDEADTINNEQLNEVWIPNAKKAQALLRQYNDYFEDAEGTFYNLTLLQKVQGYFAGITATKQARTDAINEINTANGRNIQTDAEIENSYAPAKIASHINTYKAIIEQLKAAALANLDNTKKLTGYKYIPVGDGVTFYNHYKYRKQEYNASGQLSSLGGQHYGTIRSTINDVIWEMYLRGFEDSDISNIKLKNTSAGNVYIEATQGDVQINANASKKIKLEQPTVIGTSNTINSDNLLLTVNGSGKVTKNWTVNGITQLDGNTTVGTSTSPKAFKVHGTIESTGKTTVDGELEVKGTTNLRSTVNIGTTTTNANTNMYGNLSVSGTITGGKFSTIKPNSTSVDIGADNANDRWRAIYATTGNFTNLTVNGKPISGGNIDKVANGVGGNTTLFWRGDCSWSNNLTGNLYVGGATNAQHIVIGNNTINSRNSGPDSGYAILYLNGATFNQFTNSNNQVCTYITATKLYNAIYNDYAEFRKTIDLEPGRVVVDKDDGSLECSSQRLQPGAQVISDTYGHSMGETPLHKTPLAVAGRVLVYPYQPRQNYHAGMAVCSAPDGTVDIMTREEIKEYPDCIIGIVSEIPLYSNWGTDNIAVNGRIWIKVR